MTSSFSFMSRVLNRITNQRLKSLYIPGHAIKTKDCFALQVIANVPENSYDPSRTIEIIRRSQVGRTQIPCVFHVHFLLSTKKGTTLFFVHVQGFVIECHHSYKLKEVPGDLSKVAFDFAVCK